MEVKTKEFEDKRFGHNLGREERSALLYGDRGADRNGNHTEVIANYIILM